MPNHTNLEIVPINRRLSKAVVSHYQSALAEFGATGSGFGSADSNLSELYQYYSNPGRKYLVALINGVVAGGAGFSEIQGITGVCELDKFFVLPELRQQGIGRKLLQINENRALENAYSERYIETLSTMKSALTFYKKFGFKTLNQPIFRSVHYKCDTWLIKAL
ncbi:GNAT family N-acetyltransferase [Catenovulum sp. 2E275]|uniref:GNAT family N-acetyltransferase n=1 Tax=Catenovulum sp. 2E275 TaxID=2980497 RepID=UPI0021D0952F|nr:GNAT family N-acetyltransferase [Catenovulum sp. 2E275]MCU4677558.1 GNAT family N-acetyltransferase [Catenovulum sp. 2E275]